MWQCILTALSLIEEGYVVVVRDRVAHQQPADAADIMVYAIGLTDWIRWKN